MNDAANAAMAEIERNLAGTFEPAPSRLHERPRIITRPGDAIPAAPAQTLPAMLAQLLAVIEAGDKITSERLDRIEAFLGIEP